MTNFNITISVPAEALLSILTDLTQYNATLVSVGQDARSSPSRSTDISGTQYQRHTNAFEVYKVSRDLYQSTRASSFRTSDVWHSLQSRGVNATVEAVGQHLLTLRAMGLLETVGGGRGPGGYFNVVSRFVEEDEFNAEYRDHLNA